MQTKILKDRPTLFWGCKEKMGGGHAGYGNAPLPHAGYGPG